MKVSYLIALYNKEKYIADAVDSILAEAGSSCELQICIVDDGSTDNSLAVVMDRYSGDGRVVIDRFEKNRGKVAAYNRAFELADGDYLAVFGADDKVIKGRTSAMLRASISAKKSVYGGLIMHIEKSGLDTLVPPYRFTDFRENILGNRFSGGAVLIRRCDSDSIFPIPIDLKFEDWWISFHLLRIDSVTILNQPVTFYRIHGGNDIGVAAIDYESMKRNYSRHLACLSKFKPYISNQNDLLYYRRAVDLRRSFLGEIRFIGLLSRPFDKSWINLFLFNFLGSKLVLAVHAARKRIFG